MHNIDTQRNDDWHNERLGIPTASRYKEVLTMPRSKADQEAGNLSQTALSYALDILAEKLTGQRKSFSTAATEWGNLNEPLAVAHYQELTGCEVLECGFVRHQTIATGASPDGLIGIDGGIEIKCPYNTSIHLSNKLTKEVPAEYYAQIQGQIWVCGLDWVDFVSYDPRIEGSASMSIVRVEPDQKFIDNIEKQVINFNDKLQQMYEQLTNEGF
jgi:putative phage-type endonuclease